MRKSTHIMPSVNFVGIDYHKKFSVIALGDKDGNPLSTHKVVNDKKLIKEFFEPYPGIECVVESCRGYEWFVDYLKELGLTVHLSNPYKTRLIAQAKSKTDKLDSVKLMQLLAKGFIVTCYQPSGEERRLRERLRWRTHLVQHASKMKVKVHIILDKENCGLGIERLFNSKGREFLSKVPLSEPRKALLNEHMNLLGYYEDLVERENAWVTRTARSSPGAQLLMTMPGIGDLSALVLLAELGDVSRFKSAAAVANFVGLVPSVHSSADKYRYGRLTKQGSAHLRWILIQSAWQAIRHGFEFRCHFNSVMKRGGKKAAIVSVARKLLQVAYRILRDKKPYQSELVGNHTS